MHIYFVFLFLEISEELDKKSDGISGLAHAVTIKLKSRYMRNTLVRVCFRFYLEMEEALTQSVDRNETNAQRRIKESQLFNLNLRLQNTMNQYNQEVLAYRERCKNVILRELEMGRSSWHINPRVL
jgi:hypothetical protein